MPCPLYALCSLIIQALRYQLSVKSLLFSGKELALAGYHSLMVRG